MRETTAVKAIEMICIPTHYRALRETGGHKCGQC